MHRYDRIERLIIRGNKLWRIITAMSEVKKKKYSLDVIKICEDGRQFSRNIDFCGIAGWRVAYPGLKYSYGYKQKYTAEVDDWRREIYYDLSYQCFGYPNEEEKQKILKLYPDFKWILKKHNLSTASIFKILGIWKNHKEVEFLLDAGYKSLAMNKNIWSLKKESMSKVIQWLRDNKEVKNPDLVSINTCLKYNISWTEYLLYAQRDKTYNLTYDEWLYVKNGNNAALYNDYRFMCKKAGHKWSDPYWHFPKNLRKMHDKVKEECDAIDEARRIAAIMESKRKAAEEEKKKAERYKKFEKEMQKKFSSMILNENKIMVFVPQYVQDVIKQAEKLNQCLITADYIRHVVERHDLLVFVYKGNKPYATAELLKNGKKYKLGQFYGNERKDDYMAKDDAKDALKKWAKEYNVNIEDAA